MKILVTMARTPEKRAKLRGRLEAAVGADALAKVDLAFASGEAEILAALPGAHVYLGPTITREQLAAGRDLRWIQLISAGVEHVLYPEMLAHQATITNARGMHVTHMSEHVLALLLAFGRLLPDCLRWQARREWHQRDAIDRVFTLSGKTAGIVGLGSIGQGTAVRLASLGMRVLGLRRRPGPPPPGVERVFAPEGLTELLGQSDVVVISTPLTDRTRGMIGAGEIARMKRGAYLVNIARGAIVDEGAMIVALQDGQLAGAGLDVFTTEPLPADSPLWALPNVIVTPHASGNYPEYVEQATAIFAENLARWLRGDPLVNVVDKEAGY
jgi:phosphoglycerate dehydrogenase-like enzyme